MGRAGAPAGHRRAERRRALDALYQADVTGTDPTAVLEDWRRTTGEEPADYTREVVGGVRDHQREVDAVIAARSEGWSVERMPAVDRNVLRLACFELLHRPDVPTAVAIAEAVAAAKELSTDESGRFVNGVLGAIARDLAER